MKRTHQLMAIAIAVAIAPAYAQQSGYKTPPAQLLKVMRAPPTPGMRLDPYGRTVLMVTSKDAAPGIARVAEPYVKLAGVRIEPRTRARHDASSGYGIRSCADGLELVDIASKQMRKITLPQGVCIGASVIWASDGSRFAFDNTTQNGIELWVGDVATASAKRITGVTPNTILEGAYSFANPNTLLVKSVPANAGPAPKVSVAVSGPKMSEAIAGKGESSSYESRDTLGNPQDEALFDYYARAQLVRVDLPSGKVTPLGKPGALASIDTSPDGKHVLLETLKRPYSYVTTHDRFARDVEVIDIQSGKVTPIATLAVADRVPVRGVPEGMRDVSWLGGEPATLIWPEALDKGDWKIDTPERDKLMRLDAPFNGTPREVARTRSRFAGLAEIEGSKDALLTEFDANKQTVKVSLLDSAATKALPKTIWEYSMNERYQNPGAPVTRTTPDGRWVVRSEGGWVWLRGDGGSPQGDRPFLDRYNLKTGETQRVFRSSADVFERAVGFTADGKQLLTLRESPLEPANVYVRTLGEPVANAAAGEAVLASKATTVTHISDPTPEVRGAERRLVNYKRKDGVDLSFTLYTPPGYKAGTKLPAILYAYPADFADPSKAGQVIGSQKTFTRFPNYRLLLLAGYAIIDNASFPIVGDPRTAYDTYVQQLVDDAQAAVDKAVELGVVDRDRIGVTGHSHGALMTANLLAYTDLFRAGVASSGGYNKTLTPFGFQNERRSFWKAKKVYDETSAYFQADKINEPLLIVHGEDDANPGTEPVQSPKLFQAIRGNGGTTRLVMLPFEPHWYTAKESNEHFAAEMLEWFDRWVKNAPPRAATP